MAKRATSQKSGKAAARKATSKLAEPPAYTVFISHSSKEKWIAGQISKEIEALGVGTWLDDKDLHGGDDIKLAIKSGIHKSQEVLVVVSANSTMSQWVFYEVAVAETAKKRITPILNNIGPEEFALLQPTKARDLNEFDKFLLELAGRAKATKKGKK